MEATRHALGGEFAGQPDAVFDGLLQALEAFHGQPTEDDVSLLEVVIAAALAYRRDAVSSEQATGRSDCIWPTTFRRCVYPRAQIPCRFCSRCLMEVLGLREHGGSLFTILQRAFIATRWSMRLAATGLLSQTLIYQGFTQLYYQARKGASGYVAGRAG